MSFCRIIPFLMVASATVGGIAAPAVGTHISYGVVLGALIGFSPLLLLGLLVGFLQLWQPERPRCLRGDRHYDFVTMIRPIGEDPSTSMYHYCCLRCGRDFVASGNAFEVMDENGVPGPYMTHSQWGRWRPADG